MSMKRSLTLAVLFVAILAGLVAAPVPSRIVMGGKAVVMLADAAYLFPEAKDRIVAIAKADQGLGLFLSGIDPHFDEKAAIDRAAGAEVYASFSPDLVILKSAMKKSVGSSLDAIGIKQLYLNLETPEDYFKELRLLGEVFGNAPRAEALVGYYQGILERLASRPAVSPRPRVLVLQAQAQQGGTFEVPPAGWMQTILVERAGGIAVWKDANPGSGWARVGPEQIAAWNPDIIFLISYREDSSAVATVFRADPRFSRLAATEAGRVYAFPQDFYSWDQPDARWGLGLLWLAKRINPPAFGDLDMLAETRRFFSFGYGIDGARFDALIKPKLSGDLED